MAWKGQGPRDICCSSRSCSAASCWCDYRLSVWSLGLCHGPGDVAGSRTTCYWYPSLWYCFLLETWLPRPLKSYNSTMMRWKWGRKRTLGSAWLGTLATNSFLERDSHSQASWEKFSQLTPKTPCSPHDFSCVITAGSQNISKISKPDLSSTFLDFQLWFSMDISNPKWHYTGWFSTFSWWEFSEMVDSALQAGLPIAQAFLEQCIYADLYQQDFSGEWAVWLRFKIKAKDFCVSPEPWSNSVFFNCNFCLIW